MNQNIRDRIKRAFVLLIRPIVRLAIRNGIVYREFSELCRNSYVQIAFEDYGVGGRNTNTSRIALITGINRKDIKKIKDAIIEGTLETVGSPDRISRVLTGWHQDPRFIDGLGQPLLLPLEAAEPAASFTLLVKDYGGDIAPVTLIKEFKRSQVVIEDEQTGLLKIIKRFYIPTPAPKGSESLDFISPEVIEHAGSLMNDHATTIYHNLYRDDLNLPAKFERRATNFRVDKVHVDAFRILVEQKAQHFLEELDEWLSAHELPDGDDKQSTRLGMGVYWIEGEESQPPKPPES